MTWGYRLDFERGVDAARRSVSIQRYVRKPRYWQQGYLWGRRLRMRTLKARS